MIERPTYSVGELAELGGVSRRTVRYYVTEGLIPPPVGLGRGAHYVAEHLEQLLRVKSLQERGLTLEAIRFALDEGAVDLDTAEALPAPARTLWSRIELLPGVELNLSGGRRVPSPAKLRELVEWCERNIPIERRNDDD